MDARLVVISADCHMGNSRMNWEPWLDPEYLPVYRERRKVMFERGFVMKMLSRNEHAGRSDDIFDLRTVFPPETLDDQLEDRRRFLNEQVGRADGLGSMTTGGDTDPERRLRELEADGTVADVVMGQSSPLMVQGHGDPALLIANCKTVNRWMSDFVSHHPERHAGAIAVPLGAPIEAVVEQVRWGRAHGLRGGIQLTTSPEIDGLPLYSHSYYEPLWAACTELDVPVLIHGGTGALPPKAGGAALWILERGWFHRRPLRYFILGGVFERHPRLKVVFIETSAYWVVDELRMLDEWYLGTAQVGSITREHNPHMQRLLSGIQTLLPRKPSEYFHSNCYVGLGAWPACWAAYPAIGVENIVWGSDYPHNEASWPHSMQQVSQTTRELRVPAEDLRKILGANAARIWGFDLQRLQPVADRVGPSLQQLQGQRAS